MCIYIYVCVYHVCGRTPADQAIVKQAAVDAGQQEIAIARKGLAEAGQPLLKDIGSGIHQTGINVPQFLEGK